MAETTPAEVMAELAGLEDPKTRAVTFSAVNGRACALDPFTPRRAPDCPLRQDGHGSHLPPSG
ncbi:hypothetical protein SSP24_35530 [Streptomyces spinoverrucosus]|uniref:Uncharacterized protein n=1 Tax=Streptomyces spinoverrucosus TaxID=284043 RepID=A0A4Y3VIF2_9ACTN|nr:hypothetical protein [Streptomyces spinoverrucosus]GEC05898.1 hypothetical protein SSP24_35530 [Streptomyces spinoverrucosus]GHB74589.1 hypothetical protein GCM10010397_51360 [Streptomyces spinoverrucosus]